ncbi:QRFP-like peptide receptor [Oculina patagonica]
MSESADVAVTTILTTLIIADIIGNCLVIIVIKRSRDMRTPIDYLLVNLAISDITFAVFVTPNHIFNKTFTHPEGAIGSKLCTLVTAGNVAWLGAASSSVTLVAIAVERYFTVMCPLGSKGKLTKRKVKVILSCCWIFSVALNMPLFLVSTFDESIGDCKWDWPESWMGGAYDTAWLVLLAIIPLIVMTGLYSRVVYMLWFKRNDGHELAFPQKGVVKVRKRVTLSVITVSAIFGVCWIVGLLTYILSYHDIYMFGSASYAISDTLFMFNSAVNPFVYCLMNERFREKIKRMLCNSCASRVDPSCEPYNIELPNNTSHVTHTAGASME